MSVNTSLVPELNTKLTQPLFALEKKLVENQAQMQKWFHTQWELYPPPVYGSVDLRHAGFKLAPIDMNLFPAGFNNLNPNFLHLAIEGAKQTLAKLAPNAQKILVIPESHTRNLRYWENINTLKNILQNAGYIVEIGLLNADIDLPQTIRLENGQTINVSLLLRHADHLCLQNFEPDLVLLNNDLSSGIPPILQNLNQQLIPPAELGWSQRLKSSYFNYYAEVVAEFAQQMNIDSWLLMPLFKQCGQIDFLQQEGMQCIEKFARSLFAQIEAKYAQYNIPQQPFLIVKADAGTYGMAVMTVRHPDELISLNRKQRTKMAKTKGGQPVTSVIIQEGVYTFETLGPAQAVAEPVVYMWGNFVVGGFYRVHKQRGIDENLNAPGMHFEPLAFSQSCHEPKIDQGAEACNNRFYMYGVVASLSMLAAAREIKDQMQK